MHWEKITIIGVGLLGGSLGLALKQRRLARTVVGFVRRAASVRQCRDLGAVDLATCDLARAVAGAELIILCTPIAQMRALAEQMLPIIHRGAVVTDVGSAKGRVVRELEGIIAAAAAYFVGSHPMAGDERMGVRAARADLFVDAICVITPTRGSNKGAVREVQRLWTSVGARPFCLRPEAHDLLVSRSSHLPHVLATQLAHFVLGPARGKQQGLLCANGFRDMTRIASGSPEMWRDVALANRKHLLRALDSFACHLQGFRRSLRARNGNAIFRFFQQAKMRRDRWSHQRSRPSAE